MKNLLESGVHFGHQTKRWDPRMKKFIFAERNGIHIIDLQKTIVCIKEAYEAVRRTVLSNKAILFVGTKKQAQQAVQREAERCGMFYVNNRWLGGMLTNFATIKKSLLRLKKIDKMEIDGTFESLTKKEVARLNKERGRLEKNLGGIKEMKELPGAIFVIDTRKEAIAVAEAQRMGIPIVAVVDTNCNPDGIDYPIPGNDDAIRAITLFTQIIANAVVEADNEIGLEVIENLQDEDEEAPAEETVEEDAAAEEAESEVPAEAEETEPAAVEAAVETAPVAAVVAEKTEEAPAATEEKAEEKEEEEAGFTDEDYSDYQPDEEELQDKEPELEIEDKLADQAGIDEDEINEE
jgi:small subunit ribosomal protein S2